MREVKDFLRNNFEKCERAWMRRLSFQSMTPREAQLTGQLEECQSALVEVRQENALLRQKIDLLVKRVFGAGHEPLDAAQLELLLQLPATIQAVLESLVTQLRLETTKLRSRKERAQRLPAYLWWKK